MSTSFDSGLFVGAARAAERPRTPSRRTVARHRHHAQLLSPPLTSPSPDSTSKSPLPHSTPDMSLRRLGITPSPSPFSSLREQLSPPRRSNLAGFRRPVRPVRPDATIASPGSPNLSSSYSYSDVHVHAHARRGGVDEPDNTASAAALAAPTVDHGHRRDTFHLSVGSASRVGPGPRSETETPDMVDLYDDDDDRDQSSASSLDYGNDDRGSYTQDGSRHVLIERLHDLARHIAREGWIGGGACAIQNADLSQLHAQLNDMERLIHAAERRSSGRRTRSVRTSTPATFPVPEGSRQRHSLAASASPTPRAKSHMKEQRLPLSPAPDLWPQRPDTAGTSTQSSSRRWSWLTSPRQPDTPASSVAEDRAEDRDRDLLSPVKERHEEAAVGTVRLRRNCISHSEAKRIAAQAEQLEIDLQAVFASLHERQEESGHLHDLLLERAEAAASRVLELEKEVTNLEDEVEENESELKHLRLKLRALEAVCQGFVYSQADVELVQSIENWKSDWEDVRTRMYKRRKTHRTQKRHHDAES